KAPLVVAPAMDGGMFEHPATQANLAVLRSRGALVVKPEVGHLASGLTGRGRLAAEVRIIAAIRQALGRRGP
ncbi:MAG: bifunctional phosphopantothenoylcysteine decarboxylase/phosphopantothenate--cysteine ligase CoaBC, partial [Chloroflexota bacterium]